MPVLTRRQGAGARSCRRGLGFPLVGNELGQRGDGAPVVGFDLDMTLVDSAEGIALTLVATLGDFGRTTTRQQIWALNGMPLEQTMSALAPGIDAHAAAERYRELYPRLGVPATRVLPGAVEALHAVRAAGGRTLIVSAKIERAVRLVIEAVGIAVDDIAGGLFAEAKGSYLRRAGAQVYVGDHPGDVLAARTAGAISVGVATGPHSASVLAEAGADVVLPDLGPFPQWLAGSGPAGHGRGPISHPTPHAGAR